VTDEEELVTLVRFRASLPMRRVGSASMHLWGEWRSHRLDEHARRIVQAGAMQRGQVELDPELCSIGPRRLILAGTVRVPPRCRPRPARRDSAEAAPIITTLLRWTASSVYGQEGAWYEGAEFIPLIPLPRLALTVRELPPGAGRS
jgi:hypothetical protein